jgi:hypothetical protein
MVHQQIQQIQQRMQNVSQMAGQLRQAEESNRQRLMQLAQEEAFVAQQMNRIQQLCQESISTLQSISYGTTVGQGQQSYVSSSTPPVFGQGYGSGAPLFNLATMSPDTYENVMQYMGGPGGGMSSGIGMPGGGMTGISSGMGGQSYTPLTTSGQTGSIGSPGQGTQSTLSDITTMGPSVYLSSREQLGKGASSLNQIGQQAGITTQTNPQTGQMTGLTGTTKSYNQ